MIDHPAIDFDGDGTFDAYDTVRDDGAQLFFHHDGDGHLDAIARDGDHDGLVDMLVTDTDGDGSLENLQTDTDGDGYMDTSQVITGAPHLHPSVDFDGDGSGDPYYTATLGGDGQMYVHPDGLGHVDALGYDLTGDGLLDFLLVDKDGDARFDHQLMDTDGDGYMDVEQPT